MKGPLLTKLRLLMASTAIVSSLFISCKKDYSAEDVPIPPVVKDYNLILRFSAVVDTNELEFGKTYRNYFRESYSVSAFKFYIHGIEMINTDSGKVFRTSADKYFLVDFADSTTTILKLSVLPYKYNRIGFTVGVDSARNVSGAQTGALDPAKGMFWTWNTGYIMAKLEGNSGSAAGGKFEYHIGGFSGPDNVIKKPILLFPFGETIDMKPDKVSEIIVTANISNWFYNPHDLKFSENPVCTTPGPLARQIAENYSKMFTVVSVRNE
jgi:hypothetical protein